MSTEATLSQRIETCFSQFIPPTFPKYEAEWPNSTRTSSTPLNPPDYEALRRRYNPTIYYPMVCRVFPAYPMAKPRRRAWWKFWQTEDKSNGKIFYLDQQRVEAIQPDVRPSPMPRGAGRTIASAMCFEDFEDLHGHLTEEEFNRKYPLNAYPHIQTPTRTP